ncbi:MAG: hypothetical protein WDN29_01505 [Methylovirgula sp.]
MTRIRREILSSGITWDAPILWYAKAVRELQKRPIDDKTSWLFLAAIHGITVSSWTGFGYLAPGAPLPENRQSPTFWNQCQHQTWYFWPWHRGGFASSILPGRRFLLVYLFSERTFFTADHAFTFASNRIAA